MKLINIVLILLLCNIQLYSQMKVGSNPKSISNNNVYFEIESTNNQKIIVTKDSAKMGLGVISPTNLLHIKAAQNPLRLEGLSKGDSTEGILTINDSGVIRKVSSINVGAAYEPWFNVATNRGATLNTQNIYQMGRVGIGNSSPSSPLVVQGVTGNGVLKLIAPSVAAGDNWWMGFGHGTTSTDANDRARIGVDILGGGFGRLFFTTGAAGSQTRAMFIDENQRVGIGTNSPSNKLHVLGNALFTPRSSNDGLGGEPVSVEIYGKSPSGTATQVGGIKMGWYNATGGIEVLRGGGSYGVGLAFNVSPDISGGTTFEAMRIMLNGNVGIGKTAPSEKLDVTGNIRFSGVLLPNNIAGTAGQFLMSSGASVSPVWTSLTATNTPNIYSTDGTLAGNRVVTQGANNLTFGSTTGNLIFNPSTSGRMGVGTTSPQAKLHINSELAATNTINADASVLRLSRPSTVNINWDNIAQFNLGSYAAATPNAETRLDLVLNNLENADSTFAKVMTWQANGNVGIGKTAPASILDIASTSGSITNTRYSASNTLGANLILQKSFNNTNLTNQAVPAGDIIGRIVWKSNTGAGFNSASSAEIRAEQVGIASATNNGSKIIFATSAENTTNFSDRMTITDAGNVGIGTTAPSGKLHVYFASGGDQPTWERTNSAGGSIGAFAGKYVLNNLTTASTSLVPNSFGVGFNFAYKSNTESEIFIGAIISKLSNYATNKGRMDFIVNGPTNGLDIAMTIDSNKNVGIGTTAPTSKLEVNGAATNTVAFNAAAATSIDFSASNIAITSATATAITLNNLKNGGAYTLIFTSTAATGTVAFSATGFTFVYVGTEARTSGKKHIYSLIVAGTEVYVTMGTQN